MISVNKDSNIQSVVIDGKAYHWAELQKMTSLPTGIALTVILNNGASWKIYGSIPVTFNLTKDGSRIKGLGREIVISQEHYESHASHPILIIRRMQKDMKSYSINTLGS